MPNWCYNSIEIHGDSNERDRFDRFVYAELESRKDVDQHSILECSPLSAFIPMPEYYKTQVGFNDGGYDWCVSNWGTKWPEHGHSVESNAQFDRIEFDTAWSPPVDGYLKISSFFDTLTFCHVWSEMGMAIAGYLVYRAGKIVAEYEIGEDELPDFDSDEFAEELSALHEALMERANRYILRIVRIGE